MAQWQDDEALFALLRRELFSAVIGDVLDRLNFVHQFLPPEIQPLRDDMVVIGRAMPVLTADYFGELVEGHTELSAMPFGLLFRALDDLKSNEVYLGTGGTPRYAMWGELMTTRAKHLGSSGAVIDGYSRDTPGVLRLNFPTFTRGRYAQDSGARSRVIDFRVPVEIGRVTIQPGDLIFGDLDGVLVIPREAEEETITRALEKARTENRVKQAIEAGMSSEEAFATYGVM